MSAFHLAPSSEPARSGMPPAGREVGAGGGGKTLDMPAARRLRV